MDVSQYLEIFLDETKEHLQSLNTQILNLEHSPEDTETINEIFRAAHSLKGMAGTMGYKRMQALTHEMESAFDGVRTGVLKVRSSMIDAIFQAIDALEEYVGNIQESADEGTNENIHIIKSLQDIIAGRDVEVAAAAPEVKVETEPEPVAAGETEVIEVTETGSAGSKGAWQNVPLGESETAVLTIAKQQGKNVFGITVEIQSSCLLKAARAFLVFKAIEDIGEIIVSEPPTQDIEDERFEQSFSMVVITEYPLYRVIEAAESVSEIERVTGGDLVLEGMAAEEDSSETPAAESLMVIEDSQETQGGPQPEKKSGRPVINRTVRVDIEKLDVLMNLVSELIIAKNSLVSATSSEESTTRSGVNEQIEYLESVTTNLHESVMKVRMVPIESVVNKFPRMIRDLSKKMNKKMELYMSGEETELDRTVVDEIGDPLMHLLRNAADHGLEDTSERIRQGKPESGSIFLDAYQEGNNVVIEVRDDGAGINVDMVKKQAIKKGIITFEQGENMTDNDVIDLLFHAGFSTAAVVSDVSGRGVGLDVVRSKIEALSGEVEVRTTKGEGSTWIVRLPLTLAIIQALMVTVGGEKYALSLGSIQTIEDIKPENIKYVQAKEVINLRGTVIPIIRMNEILDIESMKEPNDDMIVVIVKKAEKLAGLVVDELMGQQEIVIKSLGKYISKCRFISGATILGDGEVALILDANVLI
ncbi:MAG: chemotaxis protein CheA [Lachnospiraceae bacterium]|jgi:two-component system chemotaxis sensor kinase CheA|nr:chemotaxis protein CheA [Lachnospiraceae bacterium]